MKNRLIKFLLYLVTKLKEPVGKLQSVNRQDVEIITKAFPPFSYKQGMNQEEIALGVMKSEGEQRVINFIVSRMKGRIGAGINYD